MLEHNAHSFTQKQCDFRNLEMFLRCCCNRRAPGSFDPATSFRGIIVMAVRFLKIAALYLVAGMTLGAYMGVTEKFTLAPVHAHVNMLGFMIPTLVGLIGLVRPAVLETRLATAFFRRSADHGSSREEFYQQGRYARHARQLRRIVPSPYFAGVFQPIRSLSLNGCDERPRECGARSEFLQSILITSSKDRHSTALSKLFSKSSF